jgi:hypothetical protein
VACQPQYKYWISPPRRSPSREARCRFVAKKTLCTHRRSEPQAQTVRQARREKSLLQRGRGPSNQGPHIVRARTVSIVRRKKEEVLRQPIECQEKAEEECVSYFTGDRHQKIIHRYEIVGSRTTKFGVKTKNLWIKQYFRR